MPTVHCDRCSRPTALPDNWTARGYTCPHCGAGVALALPPPVLMPPPAPVDPFADLDRESERTVHVHHHHRNRTRVGDAAATGFGDAFGRALGGCAAQLLIMLFVGGLLVIVVFALIHRG